MKQHFALVLLSMMGLLGIAFVGTQYSDEISKMVNPSYQSTKPERSASPTPSVSPSPTPKI